MLEMLPTPWGLVRSGVAPDHPKIKSVSQQFETIGEDPRFRFFGNIRVGEHVTAAELAGRYDAVIYAVGAQSDRALGVPGEELPGSRPRSTSSAGTTHTPISHRWRQISRVRAPSWSATATSPSTSPACW